MWMWQRYAIYNRVNWTQEDYFEHERRETTLECNATDSVVLNIDAQTIYRTY